MMITRIRVSDYATQHEAWLAVCQVVSALEQTGYKNVDVIDIRNRRGAVYMYRINGVQK